MRAPVGTQRRLDTVQDLLLGVPVLDGAGFVGTGTVRQNGAVGCTRTSEHVADSMSGGAVAAGTGLPRLPVAVLAVQVAVVRLDQCINLLVEVTRAILAAVARATGGALANFLRILLVRLTHGNLNSNY